MKKIGFTLGIGKAQYSINQVYAQYIANAGFEPIAITPVNNMSTMAELCDGLLLPGGKDIEPTYYGEDNTNSIGVDPEKDAFERLALHTFREAGKPVFGICRGFQLISREFILEFDVTALTYKQGISGHSLASARDVDRSIPTHGVIADKHTLYGEGRTENMFVNSIHHQALTTRSKTTEFPVVNTLRERVAKLDIIARTEFGVGATEHHTIIEGVDINWGGSRLAGVQFHPEEMNDIKLIQHFFDTK